MSINLLIIITLGSAVIYLIFLVLGFLLKDKNQKAQKLKGSDN
tara:strand:- start:22958 stop:23086 length:129 start_codon:yes stop_codon:yes gene_type:complete